MSWLDEVENNKQAYQDAIQKFLNVRDRISSMNFAGKDIFRNGVTYKDAAYEGAEKGVWFVSSSGLIEGRGDVYASLFLNKDFTSFGCTTPFNQAMHERRVFIGDGKEMTADEKHLLGGSRYTINFVTIQSYQGDMPSLRSYHKVFVTEDELISIPEDVWADLLGWVVWKSKNVSLERLEPFVSSKALDIFAYTIQEAKKKPAPKSGGCYIATACYGSYEAQEVLVFRKYRDTVLLKSLIGKQFVSIYYGFSPFFAEKLKNMPLINSMVKNYILNPIYNKLK